MKFRALLIASAFAAPLQSSESTVQPMLLVGTSQSNQNSNWQCVPVFKTVPSQGENSQEQPPNELVFEICQPSQGSSQSQFGQPQGSLGFGLGSQTSFGPQVPSGNFAQGPFPSGSNLPTIFPAQNLFPPNQGQNQNIQPALENPLVNAPYQNSQLPNIQGQQPNIQGQQPNIQGQMPNIIGQSFPAGQQSPITQMPIPPVGPVLPNQQTQSPFDQNQQGSIPQGLNPRPPMFLPPNSNSQGQNQCQSNSKLPPIYVIQYKPIFEIESH
ncbi:hypothetical protein HK103_007004 [Boothiomyces macroporosus]|uniref:Uncharacterized protein n=1 Tax=Boothiomyces macroporosus TaxID=261099 RepID=A0AAD5UGP1_9FUNG|nr:hypothetical protein HK103_007004 [Boothiomyces macroporosus]